MEAEGSGVASVFSKHGWGCLSPRWHTLSLPTSSRSQEVDQCDRLASLSCPCCPPGLSSVFAGIHSNGDCWVLSYTPQVVCCGNVCLTPVPFLSQSCPASVGPAGSWMYLGCLDDWHLGWRSLKAFRASLYNGRRAAIHRDVLAAVNRSLSAELSSKYGCPEWPCS